MTGPHRRHKIGELVIAYNRLASPWTATSAQILKELNFGFHVMPLLKIWQRTIVAALSQYNLQTLIQEHDARRWQSKAEKEKHSTGLQISCTVPFRVELVSSSLQRKM